MALVKPVHVGIAGWTYEDWHDTVYRIPAPTVQPDLFGATLPGKDRHPADELAFIARYVDMIEINSSFYRIPSPRTTELWARRVAPKSGFFFTAKLHQDFTHRFLRSRPRAAEFRAALRPLTDHHCLNGVLAQFRYDVQDNGEARGLLEWLRDEFATLAPLIVEVRHASWQAPPALQFLGSLGVTVANLDYPTSSDSFNPPVCAIGDQAYFRLHGRNHQAWFSRDADVNDVYNYDYSEAEVGELATRSTAILGETKELTIVANNHYQGKAVSAALRLKARLTGEKQPVPPGLLATYPHLRSIAAD
ncbi:MAG: hypothetical protein A3K19_21040 [Lentisphaerae bacterium RIFOXYB12_FULL_65_16]|nr:MAG: hypothetical protein A3K18_16535 [Lentisphaerae bacterium RIFOXYA12_64_32]OGV84818.1 MAG: hypothetical protein A3K19_21040 [Lentisphaerae bacterium RIFOXYB12_FULL_65_16]